MKIIANRETAPYISFIEVYRGRVHLMCDYNPDNEVEECELANIGMTEDEVLGSYNYGEEWTVDQNDPRLATDFGMVWDEINGKTCGGIEIDDYETYKNLQESIDRYEVVRPEDIAKLTDGIYVVYTGK